MSIIIIFIFKKSGSGGPVELLIDLVSPNGLKPSRNVYTYSSSIGWGSYRGSCHPVTSQFPIDFGGKNVLN